MPKYLMEALRAYMVERSREDNQDAIIQAMHDLNADIDRYNRAGG